MNPSHLRVTHASGYIEEINGNKCLIFDSTDEKKKKSYLKSIMRVLMELKMKSKQ